MKKTIVLFLVIILAFSCTALAATKTATKKPAPKPKLAKAPAEWAAKVNNDVIPMDWYVRVLDASKKQVLKEISLEAAEERGILKEMRKNVLEQIIEVAILMQWAQREGIEVMDKTIKDRVQALKKGFPTAKEFHKSLAEEGRSISDVERDIKKQIIIDKLINMRAKNMAVSDEEIKAFYDKNIDLYVQRDKLHLNQLLYEDLPSAELGRKALVTAEVFGGEDIGLVEKGQLPVYDDSSLFDLKKGELSNIMSGEAGYYVFELDDIIPGKETAFKDAEVSIRKFLLNEKARSQYQKDLQEEKANAKITINEKLIKLF